MVKKCSRVHSVEKWNHLKIIGRVMSDYVKPSEGERFFFERYKVICNPALASFKNSRGAF